MRQEAEGCTGRNDELMICMVHVGTRRAGSISHVIFLCLFGSRVG